MTRLPHLRPALRACVLPCLLAACTDFRHDREVNEMTGEVRYDEISTDAHAAEWERYYGYLRLRCTDGTLRTWMDIRTNVDVRLPHTLLVRLDDLPPHTPDGWHARYENGRTVIHFAGPTRRQLFAYLDRTRVLMVQLDGTDWWGEPRATTIPLPTRGFRRAARKLPCALE